MKNKAFIMCGLPGSFKTTWAIEYVKNNRNAVIISKDSIRQMISGVYEFENDREPLVKRIVNSTIAELIGAGVDIIIDETNITKAGRVSLVMKLCCFWTPVIVWCKGNGNNIENRMKESRGYTKEKWKEVIEGMAASFEAPTSDECEVLEVGG